MEALLPALFLILSSPWITVDKDGPVDRERSQRTVLEVTRYLPTAADPPRVGIAIEDLW